MAFPTNPIYKIQKAIPHVSDETILKFNGGDNYVSFHKNLDKEGKPISRHYRDYLEWVEAGNTAEASD